MPFIFTVVCKKTNLLALVLLAAAALAVLFGASKTTAQSENEFVSRISAAAAPQATFTVNRTDDAADASATDNICDVDLTAAGQQCTLRAAVQQANATPEADTIDFSLPESATINLGGSALLINRSVEIRGPGARKLTIQRSAAATTPNFTVISINGPAYTSSETITVGISGVTIANGAGVIAGGIYHFGASALNLTEVTIRNNRGANGGVHNAGNALNILRSTFNDNTATASGGGIFNSYGAVNIANSTISNNTATANGGGIFNADENSFNNTLTLNNVTVANNTAAAGGGVTNRRTAFVRNTIIAANTAQRNPDVEAAVDFVSLGNNLIGVSDIPVGFFNGVGGDIVGTTAAPVNPLLNPLQNNGGPTDTLALIPASPAVDAGNPCVVNSFCPFNNPPAPLLTDQRGSGSPRLFGVSVDIGAYELSVPEPVITSISPTRIAAGSGDFEIVVNGSGFVNGSIVQFGGENKPTTFVSPTQLRARISAADVQMAGQIVVSVFNPMPGGGVSNQITFVVFNCSYTLNPTSQNFTATGGNGSIAVSAPAGCAFNAVSNAPWITIVNGAGNGNGTVTFTVAANTGVERTGTITIGGQTYTITQASGCAFALNPTSAAFPVAGGEGSFAITTAEGCQWTATSNVPWITVTTASGTGTGTVRFTVQANAGNSSRTGTITAGGQTFTVTQASTCSFTVTPTSLNTTATGSTGSVIVTAPAGCTYNVVSNSPFITVTSGGTGTGNGTVTFTVAANPCAARVGTLTIAEQTVTVNQAAPTNFAKTAFDFDCDGRADLSVFRPSTSTWFILQSSNNSSSAVVFGQAGDLIAPADFDGDGRTDIAVFRFGVWFRINSSTNQFVAVQFGASGDIPVAADYDGDGLADIAVFRPSQGIWYRLNSSNNQIVATSWGVGGDIPVIGDFDGDGRTDLTVFRPSNAEWYVLRSSNNSFFGVRFGIPGDIPAAADFDGDRRTDISVYRPSVGTWYRINSSDNQFVPQRFGTSEDKPVAADYDGDGRADVAVYRPSNSFWYVQRSRDGFLAQQWGTTGDLPVPALNR